METYQGKILSRNYQALRDLEKEYQLIGKTTHVSLLDSCAGLWMLSVQAEK